MSSPLACDSPDCLMPASMRYEYTATGSPWQGRGTGQWVEVAQECDECATDGMARLRRYGLEIRNVAPIPAEAR